MCDLAGLLRDGASLAVIFVPPDTAPRTAVVPNERGLQRFVYSGTRDFIRRVSRDVSIGVAFKGDERSLDHYFTLCRQP